MEIDRSSVSLDDSDVVGGSFLGDREGTVSTSTSDEGGDSSHHHTATVENFSATAGVRCCTSSCCRRNSTRNSRTIRSLATTSVSHGLGAQGSSSCSSAGGTFGSGRGVSTDVFDSVAHVDFSSFSGAPDRFSRSSEAFSDFSDAVVPLGGS